MRLERDAVEDLAAGEGATGGSQCSPGEAFKAAYFGARRRPAR